MNYACHSKICLNCNKIFYNIGSYCSDYCNNISNYKTNIIPKLKLKRGEYIFAVKIGA